MSSFQLRIDGRWVGFSSHQKDAKWNSVPGIYLFSRTAHPSRADVLYVGQCSSFRDRIPSHERWDEAARLGALFVSAYVEPLPYMRDRTEKALIEFYRPPLNTQLKPQPWGSLRGGLLGPL